MLQIRISAACLMVACLAGCEGSDLDASKRTGALGFTTEGVDDMGRSVAAKPAAQPAQQPQPQPQPQPEQPAPAAEKKGGIFGRTTQDVGKFDPNAPSQTVSDQKINATNPITAPLSAYSPMIERIEIAYVTHALNLFQADQGRFPKDHDEFMEKIIKANNIKLPVLPYGGRYMYDEKEHVLKVVRSTEDAAKQKSAD